MNKHFLLWAIVLFFSTGCEQERPADPVQPPPPTVVNTPPAVYAGANISVFLPSDSAFLSGSATDAENNIATYRWSQLYGNSQALIQIPDLPKTKISKLLKGEYTFELTVIDKGNLSGKATVKVLVIDSLNTGANIKILKDLQAGCWGGECTLAIDSSFIPRNMPFKIFFKSEDTAVWTEVHSYFFSSTDKWFWIQFGGGDMEESKKWNVMIMY